MKNVLLPHGQCSEFFCKTLGDRTQGKEIKRLKVNYLVRMRNHSGRDRILLKEEISYIHGQVESEKSLQIILHRFSIRVENKIKPISQ